ncbi:Uncharacterized protein dnm_078810 [Desulfonema magnum]|uniref:Uncharacterized protein n=1 Tax=Desulfonema magnum TaxID=45655 RepID=A0A975BUY1_9BACT|nr:Uncharacterized protein dnm_078810 [Desulfonema magnum]
MAYPEKKPGFLPGHRFLHFENKCYKYIAPTGLLKRSAKILFSHIAFKKRLSLTNQLVPSFKSYKSDRLRNLLKNDLSEKSGGFRFAAPPCIFLNRIYYLFRVPL